MPLVQEGKLRKELTEQGFRIEEQDNGFIVYGDPSLPDKGIVRIHSGSLKNERSSIIAVMRKLEAIGFKPKANANRLENLNKAHNALRVKSECGIDGCKVVSNPAGLGQHRKSKHKAWWAERHPANEVKATSNGRIKSGPVRVRYVEPKSDAEKAKRLVQVMTENSRKMVDAAQVLVQIVHVLENERNDMKRRLDKLEKLFGEAVDAL